MKRLNIEKYDIYVNSLCIVRSATETFYGIWKYGRKYWKEQDGFLCKPSFTTELPALTLSPLWALLISWCAQRMEWIVSRFLLCMIICFNEVKTKYIQIMFFMHQPLLLSLKNSKKGGKHMWHTQMKSVWGGNFLCTWIFHFMKTVKPQPQDFTDKRKNVDCS